LKKKCVPGFRKKIWILDKKKRLIFFFLNPKLKNYYANWTLRIKVVVVKKIFVIVFSVFI
jgi:hypothetical protein